MKQLRAYAQGFINSTTMYRLVAYVLAGISVVALALSAAGVLSYKPLSLLASLGIIVATSYAGSRLFAYTFSTKHNPESWLITALILFLLLIPPTEPKDYVGIALAAFIAVASKYVFAWRKRHIFNPAAAALVISGFIGFAHAGWWVATPPLLPFLLAGGGLVIWKTRRFSLAGVFFAVSLATIAVVAIMQNQPVVSTLQTAITSYPLIFLGTIMLTEPLTMPGSRRWQLAYAALVAVLAHLQIAWWLTPALALCIGNVIGFINSPMRRLNLRLRKVNQMAPNTYELLFEPLDSYTWKPGQYLELVLPHKGYDSHGTRRMFSIASTPVSGVVRLGITHGDPISSFKQALIATPPETVLHATYLGGDFTLDDSQRPIVFLAGGIGITPFRAMLQHMVETKSQHPVTLIYCVRTPEALVWSDFFALASQTIPLRVVPVVSQPDEAWRGETGYLSGDILDRAEVDVADAQFYASGPPAFVSSAKAVLRSKGVPSSHVKTDYFSGY